MLQTKLYYGKVENNTDPENRGRIQVRILPEMEGMTKSDLPWLRPFLQKAMTSESTSFDPLEEGSTVWCLFLDEYFHDGWYIAGVFVDGYFNYDRVKSDLGNISEIGAQNLPDAKFTRYKDGTIQFHNSNTGESGTLHKSGSYVVFDSDGNITAYGSKAIKLYNSSASIELDQAGNIKQDADGTFQFNGTGDQLVKFNQLATILNGMLLNIKTTMMMIDPLTGVTGTVQPPTIPNINTYTPAQVNQIAATKLQTQ